MSQSDAARELFRKVLSNQFPHLFPRPAFVPAPVRAAARPCRVPADQVVATVVRPDGRLRPGFREIDVPVTDAL